MILEKDKWYKFDPYNNDWSTTWYMKAKGVSFLASKYIDAFNDKRTPTLRGTGTFTDYSSRICRYTEVTRKELLWLKEIEKRDRYFPFSEMKFEEVINDYNLF